VTEPRGPHPDEGDPVDGPPATSAVPVVVALAVVGVLAVLALVFLRSDDEGRLVRPERIAVVGDRTVRAVALDQPACERIERAQVDVEDDRVLVELVAVEVDGCERGDERVDVEAEIELLRAIGDREVVAGIGRTRLPCTGQAGDVTCGPAR